MTHPTFIHKRDECDRILGELSKRIQAVFDFDQGVCEITWRRRSSVRSLPQNAQFHALVADIAQHVNSKGHQYTTEQMKELIKYKFLGTETLVAWDGTEIPNQIRSTAKLDPGEMSHLISRVLEWALDIGVKPTNPHDGEYMQRQRGQYE